MLGLTVTLFGQRTIGSTESSITLNTGHELSASIPLSASWIVQLTLKGDCATGMFVNDVLHTGMRFWPH